MPHSVVSNYRRITKAINDGDGNVQLHIMCAFRG